MGAIIEKPSICLNMTAEENLKEQYKIVGIPDEESLYEILKIVKLDNTKNKKAKYFSLGMKQRLGIAIALVGKPDLLYIYNFYDIVVYYYENLIIKKIFVKCANPKK